MHRVKLTMIRSKFSTVALPQLNSLNPKFLSLVNELEGYVSDFRVRLNKDLPPSPDIRQLEEQVLPFKRGFEPLADELGQVVNNLCPLELGEAQRVVLGSKYHHAFMESTFVKRTFEKPRGYAGDAVTMELIYRNQTQGATNFGKIANKWCTEHLVSCRAVRNRKEFLKRHIEATPEGSTILSVAAGPAREIHDYLFDFPESRKEFLALDHDMETLNQFASNDSRMSYAIGNAFGFIRGQRQIAFPRNIPFLKHKHDPKKDFKGLSSLFVAPIHYEMVTLKSNHYNLVYSAGLYDYIESFETPTKGTKALTKFLFDLVAPGGKLVIGNVSKNVPNIDIFLLASFDWSLLFRDDEEILAFGDAIDRVDIANVAVEEEPLGWNKFLVMEKV